MGTGTGATAAPLPAAPAPVDPLDAQLKARRAAMLRIAAKQGLGSTFLTTPASGATPGLGAGALGSTG